MKAITYKEKKEELEKIFRGYHRAQMKLQYLKEKSYYPSIQMDTLRERKSYYQDKGTQWIDSLYNKEELEKAIQSYEFILSCLSEESRRIIEKDFLYKDKKDWWVLYYSRSTYYRLKTRAMEEILYYFNCLERS
ncbi:MULTISPECIES: MG284/MPN403 family protein [Faecalibacillus]|uniref:MG284/MPN403 family protein n=1 Tax=Faecalibacillus TaxID=2678885 RepID=UPI000E50F4E9|nr:hypothetical protein [Faecalibacillus faecis]RGT62986.1 hypothetical protein DWX19_04620 [Coprobacillus sp. AF18-40]RGT87069.1 hypothetical protein DWX05_02510 [Coprobacillus sp. AF18-15LB]RHB01635.1 hypothetical protein DW906_11915 [Coprobacillus sp. AM42-12AC]RHH09077.1 hypothetical protein DW226_08730 [Coprobacillus sp. AM18-4LB-d2]RHP25137.1 hypothetical protein DWZ66_06435 [Coprobacillus sp. AF34-1BH]